MKSITLSFEDTVYSRIALALQPEPIDREPTPLTDEQLIRNYLMGKIREIVWQKEVTTDLEALKVSKGNQINNEIKEANQ